MSKQFPRLIWLVIGFGMWGNSFAQTAVEHGTEVTAEKTIYLPANYDFGKPRSSGEAISVLWIDTLWLLSKSVWRPNSESTLLPVESALDRAVATLAANGIAVSKRQMLHCTLAPLLFDAENDVWTYEVVFDSAAQTPASNGQRLMNLHRVIVLMDGTAFTYGVRTSDQIRANFKTKCPFKREHGEWKRGQCVTSS